MVPGKVWLVSLAKLALAFFIVVSFALLLPIKVVADDAIEEQFLPRLIISADGEHGLESLHEVRLEQYTGSARILQRKDFEGLYTDTTEVLESLNSVQIRQSSGLGSFSQTSLRGSEGKYVNIFMDGLLLNNPFSGSANLQSIPLAIIEQVEVYPDFSPYVFPHGNLAGLVNLKSRELGQQERGWALGLSYGSFDTRAMELSSWGVHHDWQMLAALNHISAENDYPVDEDIFRSPLNERQNDDFSSDTALFKLAKDYSDASVELLFQVQQQEKSLATQRNWLSDSAFTENDNERFQAFVDYGISDFRFNHRFLLAREESLFDDEYASIGLNRERLVTIQDAFGLVSMMDMVANNHQITLSLDLRADRLDQNDELSSDYALAAKRDTGILQLANDWHFSNNTLLHANARAYAFDESLEKSFPQESAFRDSDNARSIHVGIRQVFSEQLVFRWNAAKNVRIPNLFEKYGNSGLFEGNEDLLNEEARVIDVAIRFTEEYWQTELALFYKELSNGIFQVFDSRGVGHPLNIAESELLGLELDGSARLSAWSKLRSGVVLMDSRNNSNVASHTGMHMPGIYHYDFFSEIQLSRKAWRFTFRAHLLDSLYYDLANTIKADKQVQLSTAVNWRKGNIGIDIRLNNLLDENYMDYMRMPTPGRSFMSSIQLTF